MISTKKRTIFVVFKNSDDMKLILTQKEADLIESIRNFKKSYPNGEPEMRWYIERLFNELMDEEI